MGRLVAQKDHPTALAAVARLRARVGERFRFTIVGSGPEERRVRAAIRDGGLAGCRRAGDGSRAKAADAHARADVHLSASRFEGLSNTVMEAMAHALPIVATGVGDNARLVTRGRQRPPGGAGGRARAGRAPRAADLLGGAARTAGRAELRADPWLRLRPLRGALPRVRGGASVSDRRRIAFFGARYLPSRGGVSRVVEDLLIRLRDRYDLTVYCEAHEDAATAVEGVEVIQFPRLRFGSLGVLIHYALCCLDLLRRGQYDLVHVHKTDAAPFLPLLTRRFRCVATSHEAPYRRDKWSWIGRLYFRLAERIFMRSRATLTCISRPLCEEYSERWQAHRGVRAQRRGLRQPDRPRGSGSGGSRRAASRGRSCSSPRAG